MTGSPSTMRAFALADFDTPPQIHELPVPEPREGEVLVRVEAASINAFDSVVSRGLMRETGEYRFPVVLGSDFAGRVAAVGPGATRFAVGDDVVGLMPPSSVFERGSFAEYVAVPEAGPIAPRPSHLGPHEAAALGLAATAAQAAIDAVEPVAGERVLVVGATGGVGNAAVQLAAARGAHVIATGLPEDETQLRALGAKDVVDYRGDLAATVRDLHPDGVDALIDLVGRDVETFTATSSVVRPGGRATSSLGAADVDLLASRDVVAANINAQGDPATFGRAVDAAAAGDLRVVVSQVLSLDEVGDGLERIASGQARGKMTVSLA